MSIRRSLALARQELLLLRQDPTPLVVTIAMPLVIVSFVKAEFRVTLRGSGFPHATGAEQAVPGMAIMFGFFLVGFLGLAFFREHGWNTWDRLRMTLLSRGDIILGKSLVGLTVVVFQLTALFAFGVLVYNLKINGSLAGLALVGVSLAISTVAIALMFTSLCRTVQQLQAVTSLGAIALAGLGGALAPVAILPVAARRVSPATPTYWAMRGFNSVLLQGKGVGSIIEPVLVLLTFSAGFLLVALWRFRFDDLKRSWL
jgi:ABC-2 type transport system permease protein